MSWQVNEILGLPPERRSPDALATLRTLNCPYLGGPCDGGGNRNQAAVDLADPSMSDLRSFLRRTAGKVQAGVCSIAGNGRRWVVCPRRILAVSSNVVESSQAALWSRIFQASGQVPGARLGVWTEVRIKYSARTPAGDRQSCDYALDVVVLPVRESSRGEIELSDTAAPLIIEIMTCSTSGNNKRRGTTIAQAFAAALLGRPAQAPGINYRQVWARMASQIIVKSQLAQAWGGQTVWVVQDELVSYISQTTELNFSRLESDSFRGVNILSCHIPPADRDHGTVGRVRVAGVYSGEIPPVGDDTDFNRLMRAVVTPPRATLLRLLSSRPPNAIMRV